MGPIKTVKALSSEQEAEIRNLIREEHRRVRNTQGRGREGTIDHEEYPTPEVYVVRVPVSGIPGLQEHQTYTGTGTGTGTGTTYGDDEPGCADCLVYQMVDEETGVPRLIAVDGEIRRVYNASTVPITGRKWIKATRDKFGTWWVDTPEGEFDTGTGTAGDWELTVRGADGSPSYEDTEVMEFVELDGFVITRPSANVTRVGFNLCDTITVVTNVCPVFLDVDLTPQTGTGTGTSGLDSFALVMGLRVEKTTYNLHDCSAVSQVCQDDPDDCCTGTGTGT